MKYNRLIEEIQKYWNERIHDLEMTTSPVGSIEFFRDLEHYRYDKLHYLPKIVDFSAYKDKKVLEVGCGIGIDLLRFAREGAVVTGIDLSKSAIELARKNFKLHGLKAELSIGNGEAMKFKDNTFDLVYAHGVLQYTADIGKMISECHRVLKPGGEFIGMVYNRKGWLYYMSKWFNVPLEHEDAPGLKFYTIKEFRGYLKQFSDVRVVPERFPVRSRLQKGFKAFLFNYFFVTLFNMIPRFLVRGCGWHLMAFGVK